MRIGTGAFDGRLAVQQRVLPDYRVPFFELLAQACKGGMSLFAGQPRPEEGIQTATQLQHGEVRLARNLHIFSGSLYMCHQRGLVAWLEEWNPDALVLEANPRYLSSAAASAWMRKRGRKVIGWGLGAPPASGPFANIRRRRRIAFLKRFDGLIAYSERGAREYAELGFAADRIFVAHNAVSPAPTIGLSRRPSAGKQLSVLFVGRLQQRKRVDLLLRAAAEMEPKPRLVIVGDGPERGDLERLARSVYPSALFAGSQKGAELERYFQEADLLVLPGTGGLAVQQAMAHALPVIVARGDGTQDDLVRASNGWQIPSDDLASLVAAMRNALSDLPRLRQMGSESLRIVSEEINIEKMVETFLRALR